MVRMRLELPPLLDQIVRELHAAGYRAVVVGGAVRDALLGGEPKDFDIEVYGIAYDQLAGILARHGRVDLVGKSFGVVKLTTRAATITISAFPAATASSDSATATFTPPSIRTSPRVKPPAAATSPSTRWPTIRSPDELLDFFGGAEDLKNRVLRATSDAFAEDPLRVLRGMQLACRFDLELDREPRPCASRLSITTPPSPENASRKNS